MINRRKRFIEAKEFWLLAVDIIRPVTIRSKLFIETILCLIFACCVSMKISIFIVIPLSSVFLFWRFRVRMFRPTESLLQLTRQVVQYVGSLNPYEIHGRDEFSIIARSILDVSSRMKSSSTFVKQTNDRIEHIFNSIGEGVLIVDHQGIIIQVNQILRQWFKAYGPVVGTPLMEVWRNVKMAEELKRISQKIETHLGTSDNERVLEASFLVDSLVIEGIETRIVNAKIVPIFEVNHFFLLILLFDMTQVHQVETIRKEFFANVSHELKTPITAIRGYSEILLDFDSVLNDKKCLEFIKVIEANSIQLHNLIDEMLNLTDLESKNLKLQLMPYDLKTKIPNLVATLVPKAKKASVEIQIDCLDDLVPFPADVQRIDSVILNLLDNAIKYNKTNGFVKISVRQTEKDTFIYVEDAGQGIPDSAQVRAFERFFRVDKSHTRLGGGFGLGLAIVKHIVHAHGGSISLRSELDVGTIFTICLPRTLPLEVISERQIL